MIALATVDRWTCPTCHVTEVPDVPDVELHQAIRAAQEDHARAHTARPRRTKSTTTPEGASA